MSFTPRDQTQEREDFLKDHVIARGERGDMAARSATMYDLSDCPHTAMSMVEVSNDHGVWVTEICVNCGVQVSRHCAHVSNSWNEGESVLTCDNCGIDGT